MKVIKTTFTVTVLHMAYATVDALAVEAMSLDQVAEFIIDGDGVGATSAYVVQEIAPEKVRDELLKLGNDGTFFGED